MYKYIEIYFKKLIMLILIIQLSNYNIYYHKLYLFLTFFSF